MANIFLKILDMSVNASWLILAVILLRLLLKNAPKWMNCALWGMVAVRLICPVSIVSEHSLVPNVEMFFRGINNDFVEDFLLGVSVPEQGRGMGVSITEVITALWLLVLLGFVIYAVINYVRLRKKVCVSVPLEENVWLCDEIPSAFLLGIFRPRIYLPSGTEKTEYEHIVAHEMAHLKRLDHWWKPLGYVILILHWFNPLVWAAYILFCRDVELACDERVIRKMDQEGHVAYSEVLFASSVEEKHALSYPLAFGEIGVKARIDRVLSYRKPTFWLVLVAGIACLEMALFFMTDSAWEGYEESPMGYRYKAMDLMYSLDPDQHEVNFVAGDSYDIRENGDLYTAKGSEELWEYVGRFQRLDEKSWGSQSFGSGYQDGFKSALFDRYEYGKTKWRVILSEEQAISEYYELFLSEKHKLYLAKGTWDSEKNTGEIERIVRLAGDNIVTCTIISEGKKTTVEVPVVSNPVVVELPLGYVEEEATLLLDIPWETEGMDFGRNYFTYVDGKLIRQYDDLVIEKRNNKGFYELPILRRTAEDSSCMYAFGNPYTGDSYCVEIAFPAYNPNQYREMLSEDRLAYMQGDLESMNSYHYSAFLSSEYEEPMEIDVTELLFGSCGIASRALNKEEKEILAEMLPDGDVQGFKKIPGEKVRDFLTRGFGISLEEYEKLSFEGMYYLEAFDAYYQKVSEHDRMAGFKLEEGYVYRDGTVKLIYRTDSFRGEVVFHAKPIAKKFYSNRYLEVFTP